MRYSKSHGNIHKFAHVTKVLVYFIAPIDLGRHNSGTRAPVSLD